MSIEIFVILALIILIALYYILEKNWKRAIVFVLIFVIGASISPYIENLFPGKDNSSDSAANRNNGTYSDLDMEHIAAAIEEAEALATNDDYEGALTIVKTALDTYPESDALQAKEKEYLNALATQIKVKTLEDAANYAETGDYESAIALIKNAQKTYGEDADYTSAYNAYRTSYKSDVISSADELSSNGDFLSAIQLIKDATALIGEDSELTAKSQEYEDAYVSDVITQAEELLSAKDYDGAEELVNTAKEQIQNNTLLDDESQRIASARPLNSTDIMQILAASVLSQSGTYKEYLGSDSINAFAEDQHNAFSINTGASYNMWGNEVQNVSFKISDFTFDTLSFTICGETGTSGSVTIDVYLDQSVENGVPDYSFTLDDAPYPVNAVIDVSDKTTLAFKVTNHAERENRIVFYGFEGT